MENINNEVLTVTNEIFSLLESYLTKKLLSPFLIQTEDGRFMELYIEELNTYKDSF